MITTIAMTTRAQIKRTNPIAIGNTVKLCVVGSAIGNAATGLLLLLIVNTLGGNAGPTAAVYFYAALAFAGLLYIVLGAFSNSLFVEGSHASPEYFPDSRRAIRVSLALLGVGVAGALVLGHRLLGLFGPKYAVQSYSSFLLLAVASPIVLANSVLTTHLRVDHRLRPLVAVTAVSTIFTLLIAYVLLSAIGILRPATGFVAG